MITLSPFRNLNRRDSTLWSSLVSVDLRTDEISATGGHRFFAPQTPAFRETVCLTDLIASECFTQQLHYIRCSAFLSIPFQTGGNMVYCVVHI